MLLAPVERLIERFDQGLNVNRLVKEGNGARLDGLRANGLVRKCGDEDNGRITTSSAKDPLQVDAAHARHLNVGNQAGRLGRARGSQELLGV